MHTVDNLSPFSALMFVPSLEINFTIATASDSFVNASTFDALYISSIMLISENSISSGFIFSFLIISSLLENSIVLLSNSMFSDLLLIFTVIIATIKPKITMHNNILILFFIKIPLLSLTHLYRYLFK